MKEKKSRFCGKPSCSTCNASVQRKWYHKGKENKLKQQEYNRRYIIRKSLRAAGKSEAQIEKIIKLTTKKHE